MFSKVLFFATQLAMTFACRLTPQWFEVGFHQSNQGLAEFDISYQDCGAAKEGEDMVCQMLPDQEGRLGGGFVHAEDTQGAFAGLEVDPSGRTVIFHDYKGSQAQGNVHLVAQMESAPSVALCEFAGTASEVHFEYRSSASTACNLTPQSQVVDFFQNYQGLSDFNLAYEDCGAANEGASLVCEFLPDQDGRLGGGFVDARDTQGAFTAIDIDPSSRTVTFHGYKGSQAQGFVNLVVQMDLAPSLARCDFVGTVSEVHFEYRTSAPTATPTFSPTSPPENAKELQILTASDAAEGDRFGSSVSIDGNVAVVGAPLDDEGAENSGSAFVYRTTDGGATWVETAKFTANDPDYFDQLGVSVGVSGSLIVVGAAEDDDFGLQDSGAAFIYRTADDGATWTETAKLTASDAASYDRFGTTVSIDGSLAVVGKPMSTSGSAYCFRTLDGGATWIETAKLTASDAGANDFFGASVGVSGSLIVVGAPTHIKTGKSGFAYIYRTLDDGATWTETAKLTANDAAAGDLFGTSVAVDGSLVIVGSPQDDDAGAVSGSAYIYRTADGGATWTEVKKLTAADAARGDQFGYSVDLSGSLAVVGAMYDDGSRGAAYAFRSSGGGETWTQVAKLTASDAAAIDRFGNSVAVSGSFAAVGAYWNDDAGSNSGSAYTFSLP